jgi:hypothetical protein
MGSALQILKKLQSIDVSLSAQVAIEYTAPQYTQLQREQLFQGLTSTGRYLPDYSFRSVFQYGKPPGPIKLFDTGDFYRGILVDVRQDIFITESADEKSTMLQNRYGRDILGLGNPAKVEYVAILRPVFVRQIKQYLAA